MNMSEIKTQTVARINKVDILVIENGEKRVAIKPICEALGVSHKPQIEKLKEDPILSSVVTLSMTTGSDGKQYEMVTIPFMYVFGWLFRIDSRNVKEESRETVMKFQIECYKALYNHFTRYADFVETKQKAIEEQLIVCDDARRNFKDAKGVLEEATYLLNKLRKVTIEQYDADTRQLKMFTDEEMKGGAN
jgi:hypothetical protein